MYTHAGDTLYLTADRTRLVPTDDPEAAYLFIATGQRISLVEARRYGLVAADADDSVDDGAKATPPRPNKARAPTENKSA